MRTIATLFLGYLLAAAMTERVSMSPAETQWDSLWTYAWIVFALPITLLGLAVVFLAFGALSGFLRATFGGR